MGVFMLFGLTTPASSDAAERAVWRPTRPGNRSTVRHASTNVSRPRISPAVRLQPTLSARRTSSVDLEPIDPFEEPRDDIPLLAQTPQVRSQPGPVADPHDFNDEDPFQFENAAFQVEPSDEPGLEVPDLAQDDLPYDDQLAQVPRNIENDCRKPQDLKRIYEITNDIAASPGEFPPECTLGDEPYEPRNWAMTTYAWKASALCHKPLYFENVSLERYGHSWGPVLEPVVSSAHFFGSVLVLPYKMGLELPSECIYDLGYYRPGSCAPRMLYPIPISLRGALFEAGAWTGGVFLFP